MDTSNQSKPPQGSDETIPAIAARLAAIERQLIATSASPAAGAEGEQPLDRAELAAELERHQDRLRDYEKTLVDRIADVDDDRRATESRLQRAWQTRVQELEERLRRHAGLMGWLLALFAVLFAGGLFLVYYQATSGQARLASEVSDLRRESAQVSAQGTLDQRLRDRLEEMQTQVTKLASSLGQLTAGEQRMAEVQSQIRRIEAEQRGLAQAVASLQDMLDGWQAEVPKPVASSPERTLAAPDTLPVDVDPPPVEETAIAGPSETAGAAASEKAEGDSPSQAAAASPAQATTDDDPTSEQPASGATGSEDRILAAEGSYALQLIGFFSRASLDEFVAENQLPQRIYYMRQTHKGRPWYTMIHSMHANVTDAKEELSRLSPELTRLEPWIRPLAKDTELWRIDRTPGGE